MTSASEGGDAGARARSGWPGDGRGLGGAAGRGLADARGVVGPPRPRRPGRRRTPIAAAMTATLAPTARNRRSRRGIATDPRPRPGVSSRPADPTPPGSRKSTPGLRPSDEARAGEPVDVPPGPLRGDPEEPGQLDGRIGGHPAFQGPRRRATISRRASQARNAPIPSPGSRQDRQAIATDETDTRTNPPAILAPEGSWASPRHEARTIPHPIPHPRPSGMVGAILPGERWARESVGPAAGSPTRAGRRRTSPPMTGGGPRPR